MGFFSWITGNRDADPGIPPRTVEEVRQALLALNRDDLPWMVHADEEGEADLVATWKFSDQRWSGALSNAGMKSTFRVLMRLDAEHHTVRSVDQEISVTWQQGVAHVSVAASAFRGQKVEMGGSITFGGKADGSFGRTSSSEFDTNDMKNELRRVVAENGWAWRGVVFAKL